MSAYAGFDDSGLHAWMVLDRARTGAFARALDRTVRPGDVVVDIGSGTGILALFAARCGARRVYAVERGGMASHITEHAAENGFADVIEVIHADFLELDESHFALKPRVFVSETIGHFPPEENIHDVLVHARKLGGPEAILIPSAYRLRVAAACPPSFEQEIHSLDDVEGVSLSALRRQLQNRVAAVDLVVEDLVSRECAGEWIPADQPMPACFQATVHVDGPARVSGICVGFDVNLADEISLSTSVHATRTHWGQTFFPVCPVLYGAADVPIEVEIRPRIPSNRNSWSWRVASGEEFRRGDAMQGMSGDKEALLRQLGIQVAASASGAR